MLTKLLIIYFITTTSYLFGLSINDSDLYKEKQELLEIKDELNEFYEIKELEYQKNKKELYTLQENIQKEEKSILKIKEDTQEILDEINRVITTKAMTMYDKMKLSVVLSVFNEMLEEGKIDEVFDIMLRMPEKRVMKIMKKLDSKVSTILMDKMRINKSQEK
jgi:hypothetical protein